MHCSAATISAVMKCVVTHPAQLGMGGAGVAIEGAGATLTGNRIVDNDAHTYIGGGVSWKGGMVTITANLIVSNTARWGGGLYAGNAPALVVNNVISGNTTDGHGSAICVETYNPNTPSFRHNTMAGNTGGDGVGIYVRDNGRAAFINTILADHEVGVGGGWSTSINFERTLWDNNITNTTTLIGDVGHLTGTAAFAADGYHLTEASAAMDAGIDAGVTLTSMAIHGPAARRRTSARTSPPTGKVRARRVSPLRSRRCRRGCCSHRARSGARRST